MTLSPSLRRRLLGWLLLSTLVMGLLALVDTWAEALRTATSVSDRVLAGSALAIAERVTTGAAGELDVDVPWSALEMLASTAQDRVFYRVEGPDGRFLTGYETLPTAPGLPTPTDGPATALPAFADAVFLGEPIRLATLAGRATTGEDAIPFSVTVAETTRARRALARAILIRSGLRIAFMIAGAATVVWLAVTLALRPLARIEAAFAARAPDDLSPVAHQVPAEIAGLVGAVNSFMDRLGTSLDALRNFTGTASHQLRTPLAIARTQVALALRIGMAEEARAAAAKADAALGEAERVLGQLLLLARVEANSGGPAPETDLTALARDVTGELVPRAAEAGFDLGFSASERTPVRGEPVLLREMLRNLIDNALLHARGGREITVSVRTQGEGGDVVLSVEDDGEGIQEARRAALARRLAPDRRFAAGRAEGEGHATRRGPGLGLGIVAEIAAASGGRLMLTPGACGKGLRAEIRLPRATAS